MEMMFIIVDTVEDLTSHFFLKIIKPVRSENYFKLRLL